MHVIIVRAVLCVAAALAFLQTNQCAAQELLPVSIEGSFGFGSGGTSGRYGPAGAVALSMLMGFRTGSKPGGFVFAVSGSVQAPLELEAVCILDPVTNTCPPEFPTFLLVSTLVGIENKSAGARILAGPSIALSDSKGSLAAQLRLDVFKHMFGPISFLASGRVSYVASYEDDSFVLSSFGIGLRLR
jgi:hypothetical protein